jgi:CRISPR-associated protein Cas1
MTATLHACGLDAGLGIIHVTENGRWSLALDLMEPFRPLIIEPLALDVFSRGILRAEHFHPAQGGIYLNAEGRKKLILQYEKRLEREFLSEHRGHRTTLRAQIQQDASDYKSQLERPLAFSPFRMN